MKVKGQLQIMYQVNCRGNRRICRYDTKMTPMSSTLVLSLSLSDDGRHHYHRLELYLVLEIMMSFHYNLSNSDRNSTLKSKSEK